MFYRKQSSILIVDDNTQNLQILANILQAENYKVAMVKDGKKALEFMDKIRPDLILLDIMMPGLDGFHVCQRFKQNEDNRDTPVIFISALNATEEKIKAFEAGGVDYITKPFHRDEVIARIRTHLELKHSREDLKEAYEALHEKNRELEIAAKTDMLTRISNRRDILEKIKYEKNRSDRSKKGFSLILTDIDDFKLINDKFGHDCGDIVLVNVAQFIRSRIRKQDMVGRWGGEEFLILLPETDGNGGKSLAGVIKKSLQEMGVEYEKQWIRVTLTFGIAEYYPDSDINECIKRADQALYLGKDKGKNIIIGPDVC